MWSATIMEAYHCQFVWLILVLLLICIEGFQRNPRSCPTLRLLPDKGLQSKITTSDFPDYYASFFATFWGKKDQAESTNKSGLINDGLKNVPLELAKPAATAIVNSSTVGSSTGVFYPTMPTERSKSQQVSGGRPAATSTPIVALSTTDTAFAELEVESVGRPKGISWSSPARLIVGAVEGVGGAVGVVVNKLIGTDKNASSSLEVAKKDESPKSQQYVPKGIVGLLKRTMRRRILNWDRSSRNWASAFSSDLAMGTSVAGTKRPADRSFRSGDRGGRPQPIIEEVPEGFFGPIRGLASKVTRPVRDFIRSASDADDDSIEFRNPFQVIQSSELRVMGRPRQDPGFDAKNPVTSAFRWVRRNNPVSKLTNAFGAYFFEEPQLSGVRVIKVPRNERTAVALPPPPPSKSAAAGTMEGQSQSRLQQRQQPVDPASRTSSSSASSGRAPTPGQPVSRATIQDVGNNNRRSMKDHFSASRSSSPDESQSPSDAFGKVLDEVTYTASSWMDAISKSFSSTAASLSLPPWETLGRGAIPFYETVGKLENNLGQLTAKAAEGLIGQAMPTTASSVIMAKKFNNTAAWAQDQDGNDSTGAVADFGAARVARKRKAKAAVEEKKAAGLSNLFPITSLAVDALKSRLLPDRESIDDVELISDDISAANTLVPMQTRGSVDPYRGRAKGNSLELTTASVAKAPRKRALNRQMKGLRKRDRLHEAAITIGYVFPLLKVIPFFSASSQHHLHHSRRWRLAQQRRAAGRFTDAQSGQGDIQEGYEIFDEFGDVEEDEYEGELESLDDDMVDVDYSRSSRYRFNTDLQQGEYSDNTVGGRDQESTQILDASALQNYDASQTQAGRRLAVPNIPVSVPAVPQILVPQIPVPQIPVPSFSFNSIVPQALGFGTTSANASISINDNVSVKVGSDAELRLRPSFVDEERIPLPTKADFYLIQRRQMMSAIAAAMSVMSERDAKEFVKDIGLKPLIAAVVDPAPQDSPTFKIDAVKGICRLMRRDLSIAVNISQSPEVVNVLCDFMEAPLKGFKKFRSQVDIDRDIKAQREATALVQRMVRSSDVAVENLQTNARLRRVLALVAEKADGPSQVPPVMQPGLSTPVAGITKPPPTKGPDIKKNFANTTIVEFPNLKTSEMAKIAMWGLGGVPWKPRMPGQKGLRILSFDGGGTRGVLSIALLKELLQRAGKSSPYDTFDIICGTSTGGIIAALLGKQRRRVEETEALYDDFIEKVFGKKSNLKLVVEQAAYEEEELEKILYAMLGDELMVDSNARDCPRIFFVSTKVNNVQPQTKLWRNYNYPPGVTSRYPGTFRINAVTAVRATTAAPTFFTSVPWEQGLYCDGALVANNPTMIALQEAKLIYPGVPVEFVVSIGTGYFNTKNSNSKAQNMDWGVLVNQLIASATDTEDIHAMMTDFFPTDKYFRFNTVLQDNLAIDEKNKSVLTDLKRIAKETFVAAERGPNAKNIEMLINALKGNSR